MHSQYNIEPYKFLIYYLIKCLDLIAKHFILIAIKKVFIYFYEFT